MRKLTILIDMDDTIEHLTDAWIKWLNKKHGTEVSNDDIVSWNFSKAFPTLTEAETYAPLYVDEFWGTVRPMNGALEAMADLIMYGHEVYIVTSSAYQTLPAKLERVLFTYFPIIKWDHVIVTANKQMIRGDVLVDDAPHNLEGFDGLRILVNASHNRNYPAEENGMIRAGGWPEIYRLICREANESKEKKYE